MKVVDLKVVESNVYEIVFNGHKEPVILVNNFMVIDQKNLKIDTKPTDGVDILVEVVFRVDYHF